MSDRTLKLRIHGLVQGVYFRGWSRDAARTLGLRGWVRNRSDGTVEMLVHGEEKAVQRLIDRCREGPPAARVKRMEVEETDEEAPDGFETRPTL